MISIHALLAESDALLSPKKSSVYYFYPRSPCGERLSFTADTLMDANFYPRSPCGERLPPLHKAQPPDQISIHALLAESDPNLCQKRGQALAISIHALLAESDAIITAFVIPWINFYPRSPCGERPCAVSRRFAGIKFLSTLSLRRATRFRRKSEQQLIQFLSTLSLRRATRRPDRLRCIDRYFYPRSPCGERRLDA